MSFFSGSGQPRKINDGEAASGNSSKNNSYNYSNNLSSERTTQQHSQTSPSSNNTFTVPSISLPKGGGAIRGIGEKFAANPVTGTGSLSVPIFTSPGRSGFGPSLSLAYDSGFGNGPFGFGWSLSLPAITRKTSKGIPKYLDADESDVFIISGAEDLVPVFAKDGNGDWKKDENGNFVIDEQERDGYTVRKYRPRTEGLFARIEHWTHKTNGDVHWRSISKDDILTVYGKNKESRISDPSDESEGRDRVFSWLICESYDDKGNAIVYEYAKEDEKGIEDDLLNINESNRIRTANRYIKRIFYGNRRPLLLNPVRPSFRKSHLEISEDDLSLSSADWMFEVIFDYDEGHYKEIPLDNNIHEDEQHQRVKAAATACGIWSGRPDSFSEYRSSFEIRTYRRCHRVLIFHRFPELGNEPYLVRSTEFDYSDFDYSMSSSFTISDELKHKGSTHFASFIQNVIQSGYLKDETKPIHDVDGVKYVTYIKKSIPPLKFEYSKCEINQEIKDLDEMSLENLPIGIDGTNYQFVDFDGEGVSGILTEQADTWFYKPNIGDGKFGPIEVVRTKPSIADLKGGKQQLMDLAGDGQQDLVEMSGPVPGFYERTHDYERKWGNFVPFQSIPNISWKDPSPKLVDLTGDGHADILITENEVFTWYQSLAEKGFESSVRVSQELDEEKGPRLVLNDDSQSLYLADMSGDGLSDLMRIKNGEVCYWPNLGYGRFGSKVIMDNSPWFDASDQFDTKKIRLVDIDGSGVTDIIYTGASLDNDVIQIYFNQSGNRWSDAYYLSAGLQIDNNLSIQIADLFGNGTVCLVWSSPLPAHSAKPMKYLDLMGGIKPHLLVKSINNLGAETYIKYVSSTKFYLEDKAAGKPWITRLPFPVHVVERMETYDYISRNLFVTKYTYHHGYFDGIEREFRGFGMVEQFDTERYAILSNSDFMPEAENIDKESHVPPVYTKTWFHTGIYHRHHHVSDYFVDEYYMEPDWVNDPTEAKKHLLDDTILPTGLTGDEEYEACRTLRGQMLRQEVYSEDGTENQNIPYTITEQNFTIQTVQPRGRNNHAVFFTHAREAINYNYERNPEDPRTSHTMTLEVDEFGNVLKQVQIGYGRCLEAHDPILLQDDREKQRLIHITCTENIFTNPVVDREDAYRTPLTAETSTYELRKPEQEKSKNGMIKLYHFNALVNHVNQAGDGNHNIAYEDIDFAKAKETASNIPEENDNYFRRLIEQVRTLYRRNDLGTAKNDPLTLLPLGTVESLALPGEGYKLSFTSGLLVKVFQRAGQSLLVTDPDDPTNVLSGDGLDRGGYVSSQKLKAEGKFPNTDLDNHWWVPTGRVFFSPGSADTAEHELAYACSHYFLPLRFRDPFHTKAVSTESIVTNDAYDLLMLEICDPVGNLVTVGHRLPNGQIDPNKPRNNYRVLQPILITDPNRNRNEAIFDALGLITGTAVMGKEEDSMGDTLSGFEPDKTQAQIDGFYEAPDPHTPAPNFLKGATIRIINDLHRFRLTQQAHPKDPTKWLPVYAVTLARETHVNEDPVPPVNGSKIQISFSYSDGFGREIQKKIQAEPRSPVIAPQWVASGWIVLNNKELAVRQYEPFFSQLPPEKRHHFEFGVKVGVSPIMFYDPVGRNVVTLHPNHTYEKVVFNPWQQVIYDVNDTVAGHGTHTGDPRSDPDIQGYVAKYFAALNDPNWQTWFEQRQSGNVPQEEKDAALKTAVHADTPTTVYFDTLGRPFLTIAHNRFNRGHDGVIVEETYPTHVELDIEGNQREIRDSIIQNSDAQGRIIMRYDYDMLGNRIHQLSMEAGARWMLNDVTGKPIRAWDSRGHTLRMEYDPLRRPLRSFVIGANPFDPSQELLTERMVYGEPHPENELRNLRGKLYLHIDQAGVAETENYDFKGNPIRISRRIAKQYKQAVDWRTVDSDDLTALEVALSALLEDETFTGRITYDALNRAIQVIVPHSEQPVAQCNIIQPVYNEANLLERMHVWLDHKREPTGLLDPAIVPPSPVGVDNIDYDAKGRRERIDYNNGVRTFYEYDPLTYRLVHLLTARNTASFPDDCPSTPQPDWPGCHVQNLRYTYDPVGNITHIHDDAQQTIFFDHQRVEPSAEYTYDAIYRLTEATGREHLGQIGGAMSPHSYNDAYNVGLKHPNDGRAMGTYTESYEYDPVGNILKIHHEASEPSHPAWTHDYAYVIPSLIEDGTGGTLVKTSNRLSSTRVEGNHPAVETYTYDNHGNMTKMPQLQIMDWDYKDQLCMTQRQKVNEEDEDGIKRHGERTYYVYDSTGQRTRKITVLPSGNLKDEHIYLGQFEVYRRHFGTNAGLVRETFQIVNENQRIAMVETRNDIDDGTLKQFIRYQFANNISSAVLELDEQAKIISYEEYFPYGSTSYQAGRNVTEARLKRYRFTGMEKDEESGLQYHKARYDLPWLSRWIST